MAYTTRHVTLRWYFERKCRCQSTFILVFKNIMWHFGFEVQLKWNLSNIHSGYIGPKKMHNVDCFHFVFVNKWDMFLFLRVKISVHAQMYGSTWGQNTCLKIGVTVEIVRFYLTSFIKCQMYFNDVHNLFLMRFTHIIIIIGWTHIS